MRPTRSLSPANAATAPYRVLRAAVRRAGRLARPQRWLVHGQERHSGEPLTLLVAGPIRHMHYLAALAFGERWRSQRLYRPLPDTAAGEAARRLGADLMLRETTATDFEGQRPSADRFFVPAWIGGETDLDTVARRERESRNVREDLRKIRKAGFEYKVTRAEVLYRQFFDLMYRPYMDATHGEKAFAMSLQALLEKRDQSELLLVLQAGEPVSGAVLLEEGERMRGWSLGVRHADRALVRTGAMAAIYHFTFRHLAETGYHRFHFGASRPFLLDGALRYKTKWGLRVVDRTDTGFELEALRPTAGAQAFLQHNPFISWARDGFTANAFASASGKLPLPPGELELPGVSRLQLFDAAMQAMSRSRDPAVTGAGGSVHQPSPRSVAGSAP